MNNRLRAEQFGLRRDSVIIDDTDGNPFEVHFLAAGITPGIEDDRPLALCLHGYPDSAWTWRHLLPELAEAGYRAVAPFNRGYWPTAIPEDGCFQAGVLGVDANRIHAALGSGEDSVIIGHDWGAMGAYAASSLEPTRWRRAVAASVLPGPVAAQAFFIYEQLKLSWYMFFQLTSLADMFIPMNDYDHIRRLWNDWSPGFDQTDDVAAFLECIREPENLISALSYYRHTLLPGLQDERLAAAQAGALSIPPIPLLYLHGENDGCMLPELARTVGEHLNVPGSRSVMISDAGHFLHLERPQHVNAQILEFLAAG